MTETTTQPAAVVEHTGQQQQAVTKAVDWFHDPDADQVFRLFGYAGTGKTTLARHIIAELDLTGDALYAAFTGKAAYVLRTKGCDGASTVHSLIYQPVDKARAHLKKLLQQRDRTADPRERDVLAKAIATEQAKLAEPDFLLKEDSELADAPLLVLDEVSMIGEKIAADLLSFEARLLVLGDPAQLPPVEGGGYFIDADPDHLLTEIHRSALDSPVTRMATAVRTSTPGERDLGLSGPDGDSGRYARLPRPDALLDFDQVIVWRNATRWGYTNVIRALQGHAGPEPHPGERIIVIANNSTHAVFNGQQLTVETCTVNKNYDDVLHLEAVDDEGALRKLDVWRDGFAGFEGEKKARANGRGRVAAATFGQVITCHKSQGSQWDAVLVVDETPGIWGMSYRRNVDRLGAVATVQAHLDAQRWAYTAVTRAAERAVVLGGGR